MQTSRQHYRPSPARYRVRGAVFATLKPAGRRPASTPNRSVALGVVAATAFVLLALTGCGSSDNGVASKSGKEILAASKEAVLEASSVHVVAKNSQGVASVSLDLYMSRNGGRGKVSLLGATFEIVRVEGSIYVKGPATFYKRVEAALGVPIKLQQGMWLKASASKEPFAQLAALVDPRGEPVRILTTPGSLVTGTSVSINGQKAVAVRETTKVYKGVLYVATTGKPYPIALVKTKGKANNEREGGRTTFSEWDRPVSLSAPSPWVDVETLKR